MRQQLTGLRPQIRASAIPWQESLTFSFTNKFNKAMSSPAFTAVFETLDLDADAILISFWHALTHLAFALLI